MREHRPRRSPNSRSRVALWRRLTAALALGALVVAGLCVVCARRPAAAKTPPAVARGSRPCRALLVSVSSYHPDTARTRDGRVVLRALKGTRNDVTRMADVLRHHGFADADVRTLCDSDATVENVVRAFADHLIAGVTKDTEVVLFFSGHGSRVPDRSGREPGGMDSSYLLYDSRIAGSPPRDLDDDALHSLLAACPSERVTVITDCCNSGNSTRGGGRAVEVDGVCYELLEAREVEAAQAPSRPDTWPFWPAGVPLLEDGAAGRRVPLPWVHVPACAAHELAYEINVYPKGHPSRGRAFGAMTHYLCMELMQTPPGTSWDVVFARMRERLCRVAPGQHPHLEGPGRRVVFGTRLLSAVFGVPARLRGDGHLALEGGVFTGIVQGMVYDVVRLTDQARVGKCIVDEVDATTASAKWETPPGRALPADDVLRAVPATPGDPERALPVARATLALIDAALRPRLLELAWLRVTDEEEGVYRFARGAGGDVSLRAPDGYCVWPRAKHLPVIDGLTLDVRCEVEFQNLWSLGDRKERGAIPLTVAIVAATDLELERLVARAEEHQLDRFELAPIPAARSGVPPRVEVVLSTEAEQRKAKVGQIAMYEFGPTRGRAHIVALELDPAQRTARVLEETGGKSWEATALSRRAQWIFAASEDQWPHQVCTFRLLVLASDRHFDVSGLLPVREISRSGDALAGVVPGTWSVGAVDLVVSRKE